LDQLESRRIPVFSVGKIFDIFLGRGIQTYEKTKSNADGMQKTLAAMEEQNNGLIFVNLVDFDQLYGHRNDVEGYARALEEFDAWLPTLLARLSADDLLVLTADHGCDPTTPSTDHSREYVPLLVYTPRAPHGQSLGLRGSLSDIGQTVAENFGIQIAQGASFLNEIATAGKTLQSTL
jgi:phosphopentomutase